MRLVVAVGGDNALPHALHIECQHTNAASGITVACGSTHLQLHVIPRTMATGGWLRHRTSLCYGSKNVKWWATHVLEDTQSTPAYPS
jgi:hypothetical protein